MKKCILCSNNSIRDLGKKRILGKYDVNYYQCLYCGLVYTEKPYWLDEAYSLAINMYDTGVLVRNFQCATTVRMILDKYYDSNIRALDYGGGYGIFVRLMRDRGFDFRWYDKYAEPLVCKGFEWRDEKIDLLTCFECFEHMDTPKEDIDRLVNISSEIIFSTDLYSDGYEIKGDDWFYYGLQHGQHVTFYSKVTLEYIAQKYGLKYYSVGQLHWFTKNKISQNRINMLIKRNNLLNSILKIDYKNSNKDNQSLLQK